MLLPCNNVSHWLFPNLDWSLMKAKHNKTKCIFHGIYCIFHDNEFTNIPLFLSPWWKIPQIVSCHLSFVTAYDKKSSLARAPFTRIREISLTQPGTWKYFLTHCCEVTPYNLVNIGSDNGLLPEGTKPLPEPMLTYQWGLVAFTWGKFHRKFSRHCMNSY